jgi:hypothetical protein
VNCTDCCFDRDSPREVDYTDIEAYEALKRRAPGASRTYLTSALEASCVEELGFVIRSWLFGMITTLLAFNLFAVQF